MSDEETKCDFCTVPCGNEWCPSKRVHECEYCGEILHSKGALDVHLRKRCPENPFLKDE